MPYQQISPGVYTRSLGDNESVYVVVARPTIPFGREHWSITSFVKIQPHGLCSEPANLELALRKAWTLLRFQHPSIATTLVSDKNQSRYTVPDSSDQLEAWNKESFFVVSGKSRDDLIASQQPELYFTLRYLPDSFDLVFHTSHWRSDGMGMLNIMDDYLDIFLNLKDRDAPLSRLYKQLPWGEEVARLTPSTEEVCNIPVEPTTEIRATAAEFCKTWEPIPASVGIKYRAKSDSPKGLRTATVRFSHLETEAVIKACKNLTFTVTSAVHASLALVNWEYASAERKQSPYTSTVRWNFRPHLPEPYNSRMYAAAEAVSGHMITVQPDQPWIDLANGYNQVYRAGLPRGFIAAHRQYIVDVFALLASETHSKAPAPSGADINSMGKIDSIIQPSRGTAQNGLEVLDVGVGSELSTPQLTLYVWTFRNQLTFFTCYNENFYDHAEVYTLTQRVKEVVLDQLQELGTSLHHTQ